MPSNLLNTDVMFPQLLSGQSTDERLYSVLNYLYMLREQLAYSLTNLGVENINPGSLNQLANIITEPVYVRLEDTEGSVSNILVDVSSLQSSMSDVEGNVSSLQQTTQALTSRVTDSEENITTLQQTSTSLAGRVTDAEGDIGQLQITAQSLTASVSSLEGSVTSISATVNGLTLSTTNGSTSSSIKLLANGVQLSSANLTFTGYATFTSLQTSGATIINGANVSTGTISAINIQGCNISGSTFSTTLSSTGGVGGEIRCYWLSTAYLAGGMRLDVDGNVPVGSSPYRLFIYTQTVQGIAFVLKLQSAGNMSLASGQGVFIEGVQQVNITAPQIFLVGTVYVNGSPIS